MKSQNTTKL